jgi:TonB family protein
MKQLRLVIGYVLCLMFLATAGCGPKRKSQIVAGPSPKQPASSPAATSPAQQPTPSPLSSEPSEIKAEQVQPLDLPKLANSVRPAVILVTVFDSSGKLLRNETGFFISEDGRFVTTGRAIDSAVNAVAKTADGGLYNVAGILASSPPLDLVILKADVKRVPFLDLSKNAKAEVGARVGVIGSALAGSEGVPREGTVAAKKPESQGDRLEIAMPSASSAGSPVVDENGGLVGIVTSAGEKTIVTSSSALISLQSQIAPEATARWAKTSETSPTPRPTPKPRVVYAPQPAFPAEAHTRPGISRSGRFRVSFNAHGNARNVQIIQSTGNGLLDQVTIGTLRQWKSTPGREWSATVPVTFQE